MGQRVDRSTGQTGHISMVYVGGPRNCLEGFFFEKVNRLTGQRVKRVIGSTGRRVNGSNRSTGQQVTFTFTILYMIADDARLTPPRCKKYTAYDDTRLTPHHCKKHTASFACSTGKFPSIQKQEHSERSLPRQLITPVLPRAGESAWWSRPPQKFNQLFLASLQNYPKTSINSMFCLSSPECRRHIPHLRLRQKFIFTYPH